MPKTSSSPAGLPQKLTVSQAIDVLAEAIERGEAEDVPVEEIVAEALRVAERIQRPLPPAKS